MQIFYAPTISSPLFTLNEEESKHCIRVLRMETGDEITLVDGKGNLFKTRIVKPEAKRCEVEIFETIHEFEMRNFYLHIAIAPTKNIERFEWFLEKATEIGINEITPILCEHSERKVINHDRLEKIIVSAMKQSVKAYLPKLNQLITFKQFIQQRTDGEHFIAHCNKKELIHLKDKVATKVKTTILIGPEGDFSPFEVTQALQNNYTEISLGKSRLRTETAGVVACDIINLINE
ncbi:MAG: 16S rRNA (uracil(1498)-N(3))-methyltransferase [Tenuifilaceae bacterium]